MFYFCRHSIVAGSTQALIWTTCRVVKGKRNNWGSNPLGKPSVGLGGAQQACKCWRQLWNPHFKTGQWSFVVDAPREKPNAALITMSTRIENKLRFCMVWSVHPFPASFCSFWWKQNRLEAWKPWEHIGSQSLTGMPTLSESEFLCPRGWWPWRALCHQRSCSARAVPSGAGKRSSWLRFRVGIRHPDKRLCDILGFSAVPLLSPQWLGCTCVPGAAGASCVVRVVLLTFWTSEQGTFASPFFSISIIHFFLDCGTAKLERTNFKLSILQKHYCEL